MIKTDIMMVGYFARDLLVGDSQAETSFWGGDRAAPPWRERGCRDTPDGALYISTGQGTLGRPIPGPDRITTIVGEILRITNFFSEH